MTAFAEDRLIKNLDELTGSQQSIETLSLWLIHHRRHSNVIVRIWFQEFRKAQPKKKLVFLYLANDVIQNSKKKGNEFNQAFGEVLSRVFENMQDEHMDSKTLKSILRILDVWQERGVYDADTISSWKKYFKHPIPERPPVVPSPPPKVRKERHRKHPTLSLENMVEDLGVAAAIMGGKSPSESQNGPLKNHKDEEVLEPPEDSPSPEKLIEVLKKAIPSYDEMNAVMKGLENSATSDAATRERIAGLPAEVSDASRISTLQDDIDYLYADQQQAKRLLEQVTNAMQLLTEYNARLTAEMETRKNLSSMLDSFLRSERFKYAQCLKLYKESQAKLVEMYSVKKELTAHLQSLPDLSKLPQVTGGMKPLPSAVDLFSH
ncbi:unnamed protein product [Darwinula stevensoni]|uniref:CID domain-containing protein n=1 Tax=Darwinula stevensoni TaxID=69355 RepID=A0A7R9ABK4_9CRUS|nr:unnamed protein product [Darwinula stevensoni]CAG0899042.1 unnamed protein product [Darwinula stevensoni]